ncbi:MAG: polysaccharide deacetylase family protein [Myxococcales bacterium]
MPPPRTALLLCALLCAACGEGVPILMYHSVGDGGEPLTVSPVELDAQLDFLHSAGFETITLREVVDAQDGGGKLPRHPVVLSFDDGYDDAVKNVLPRLLARGQKATFFIVSGFCAPDEASRVAQGRYRYLTWPEVRALADAGMEIGSHTVSHRKLSGMQKDELRAEIERSRAALQAYAGQRIDFFAYPFNDQRQWVRRAVERAGYRGAVVGAHGNTDRFTLQRLTMHRGLSPADLRSMLSDSWETSYTEGG